MGDWEMRSSRRYLWLLVSQHVFAVIFLPAGFLPLLLSKEHEMQGPQEVTAVSSASSLGNL